MKSTMCRSFGNPVVDYQQVKVKENTLLSYSDVGKKYMLCCILLENPLKNVSVYLL